MPPFPDLWLKPDLPLFFGAGVAGSQVLVARLRPADVT